MEILVCIKQVPDDSVAVRLGPDGQPDLTGAAMVVNAFDTYALEMAARLKESAGGRITVLCMGGETAKDAVKTCLAVGAERGFVLAGPELAPTDTLGKAAALAAAVRQLEAEGGQPFDLIFCGREATDRPTGQTGPQLAERLGLPVITDLVDIAADGGRVSAKQETEEGWRRVEAALPALVTVTKPAYDPRYPTIKSKLAARKMAIPVLSAEAQPGPAAAQLRLFEPPRRQAGVRVKEENAELSAIRAVELMAAAKVL